MAKAEEKAKEPLGWDERLRAFGAEYEALCERHRIRLVPAPVSFRRVPPTGAFIDCALEPRDMTDS